MAIVGVDGGSEIVRAETESHEEIFFSARGSIVNDSENNNDNSERNCGDKADEDWLGKERTGSGGSAFAIVGSDFI